MLWLPVRYCRVQVKLQIDCFFVRVGVATNYNTIEGTAAVAPTFSGTFTNVPHPEFPLALLSDSASGCREIDQVPGNANLL